METVFQQIKTIMVFICSLFHVFTVYYHLHCFQSHNVRINTYIVTSISLYRFQNYRIGLQNQLLFQFNWSLLLTGKYNLLMQIKLLANHLHTQIYLFISYWFNVTQTIWWWQLEMKVIQNHLLSAFGRIGRIVDVDLSNNGCRLARQNVYSELFSVYDKNNNKSSNLNNIMNMVDKVTKQWWSIYNIRA